MTPPTWIGQYRRRLLGATAALVLAVALPAGSTPIAQAQAGCRFVLGFATLTTMIGSDAVGECLEDQRAVANGNAEQLTTMGLLVWRKADNWTAFTDGNSTWLNGPGGLQQRLNTARFSWEAVPQPTGPPTTSTFVPCTTFGPDFVSTPLFNPGPGQYYVQCDSPLPPRVTQVIIEVETAAIANRFFQDVGARYMDPQSTANGVPGNTLWVEVPSSGPDGSRTFERLIQDQHNRQLDVQTVKGRYFVSVQLIFPRDTRVELERVPVWAGQILTALLARMPS